jgi:predicted extracellular nuclease
MTGAAYGRARQVLFSPSEELLPAIEQYSYVFRGNSQQIDHIYVSHAIFDNIATGNSGRDAVCIPHIDSIFAQNNNIETSDHDPIVVRLNLGGL